MSHHCSCGGCLSQRGVGWDVGGIGWWWRWGVGWGVWGGGGSGPGVGGDWTKCWTRVVAELAGECTSIVDKAGARAEYCQILFFC